MDFSDIRAGLDECARVAADVRDELDIVAIELRRARQAEADAFRAASETPRDYWACWREGFRSRGGSEL